LFLASSSCVETTTGASNPDGVSLASDELGNKFKANYLYDLVLDDGRSVELQNPSHAAIIVPVSNEKRSQLPLFRYRVKCVSFLDCVALKQEVHAAGNAWEAKGVAAFEEARSTTDAHLLISFESNHSKSCDDGFERRFEQLAHSNNCYPKEIHLNKDIRWSLNGSHFEVGNNKYDVRTVVMHEMAHFLGMSEHIDDPYSLMNSEYIGSVRTVDDRSVEEVHKIMR
jgi:hypothetical protein